MTFKEIRALTIVQVCIRVAELCGAEKNCFVQDGVIYDAECNPVPDYTGDLNAMNKAEDTLTPEEYTLFRGALVLFHNIERAVSASSEARARSFLFGKTFHATQKQEE